MSRKCADMSQLVALEPESLITSLLLWAVMKCPGCSAEMDSLGIMLCVMQHWVIRNQVASLCMDAGLHVQVEVARPGGLDAASPSILH